MKIHYRSRKLEKILTNERLIKRYYTSFHENLKNRLFELSAVSNLSLISHNPPPRKHKLTGEYDGYWSVDVSKNYRILFTAYNYVGENEKEIREILIEDIKDIH